MKEYYVIHGPKQDLSRPRGQVVHKMWRRSLYFSWEPAPSGTRWILEDIFGQHQHVWGISNEVWVNVKSSWNRISWWTSPFIYPFAGLCAWFQWSCWLTCVTILLHYTVVTWSSVGKFRAAKVRRSFWACTVQGRVRVLWNSDLGLVWPCCVTLGDPLTLSNLCFSHWE